ncbi:hypothetical protein J3R82DRAFT_522 [Butyriboletus roseoflavus]|nr:hypothetical protein J3R82DRAFT_522 [Butyriboletus roseoflavus]
MFVLVEPKRDILSLLGADTDTFTSSSHPTRTVLTTHKPLTSLTSSFGKPTFSTSQSPAEQWTTPWTDTPEPTAVKTAIVSTPSIPPVSATDHSSKTWQIIGIAIIAVLFVATSITCAMFFDRLWRFLKDVVCCTSHSPLSEEFILDCEKDFWTLTPSPSDFAHHKRESLREDASVHTTRARELPWNTDIQDCNTLHRQPSRRSDHAPTA